MQVVCSQCAASFAVPDDEIRGRRLRLRCKRCGAATAIEPSGVQPVPDPPRETLDTIPLAPSALAELVTRGSSDDDVDALIEAASGDAAVDALIDSSQVTARAGAPRVPQVSVPFDLQRPVVPLVDVRPPQVSIPFELKAEDPIALAPRPPQVSIPFELTAEDPIALAPRPPQPTVAFELRQPEAGPRSLSALRGAVMVVVLLVAGFVALAATGNVDAARLIAALRAALARF